MKIRCSRNVRLELKNYKELLAHYDKDDPRKKQLLIDHLIKVAMISKILGFQIGLENTCQLISLLHDFGKKLKEFQLYILGIYTKMVEHSHGGAIMLEYIAMQTYEEKNVDDYLKSHNLRIGVWKLYKEILQYPILSHHGLYDIIDKNFNYKTGSRLYTDLSIREEYIKDGLEFLDFLSNEYARKQGRTVYELYWEGFREFLIIYMKIQENFHAIENQNEEKIVSVKTKQFYYGILVRLLLSILKEADIYDSSNYYRTDKDKTYSDEELNDIWKGMSQSVDQLYDEFEKKPNKSQLDIIRTGLANEIFGFSQKYGNGVFKLDMPVGAGKTYAGLRYAVGNAKKYGKKRIFYTTAFLSVLEQNADKIKGVLGEDYILEHHSNIIMDNDGDSENEQIDDQKEYEAYAYLKESWESPVILTTLVQFTNTLFKHKASNIRRFSKLINSVIIIDEIQSLPSKAIYNFNLMTNFLTNVMNCTIIHCTATPPGLDNHQALRYPCHYGKKQQDTDIIKLITNTDVFSRVQYHSLLGKNLNKKLSSKKLITHLKDQLEKENSALIVLNTKSAVASLYNAIKADDEILNKEVEIVYLTTNQCPKHRLDIIKNMKKDLERIRKSKSEKKIVCISTKLIEAGVDIDFDIVYRSLAGMDSVIQCGGRCNREGKKLTKGRLYIFKYQDENLSNLLEIEKQRSAALTSLRLISVDETINDDDIMKACKYYFHKLYLNEEAEGDYLEYLIEKDNTSTGKPKGARNKDTILNLLTTNPKNVENYTNKNGKKPTFKLKHSFKTAAMEFELIKEDTISLIVNYENQTIMDRLYNAIESRNYPEIKRELQILQPYTINVRRPRQDDSRITKEMDGEIYILNADAYSMEVGLTERDLQTLVF